MLMQALPKIIEEAVRPMQNIDSIRIMQVDRLNTGAAGARGGDGLPSASSGNLANRLWVPLSGIAPTHRWSINSSRKWVCPATDWMAS